MEQSTSTPSETRLATSFPTAARCGGFVWRLARDRRLRRGLGGIAVVAGVLFVANYYSAENRALRRLVELDGVTSGVVRSTIVPDRWQNAPVVRLVDRMTQKKRVHGVSASGKPVTDQDVALFVAAFPECYSMTLAATEITDASLTLIASDCAGLWTLRVDDTNVTDAGIAKLARLPDLYEVSLNRTQITDAGLRDLARLPQLIRLNVAGTDITDVGLAHLAVAPKLHTLDVSHTSVTDAGVAAFRESKPHCRVAR